MPCAHARLEAARWVPILSRNGYGGVVWWVGWFIDWLVGWMVCWLVGGLVGCGLLLCVIGSAVLKGVFMHDCVAVGARAASVLVVAGLLLAAAYRAFSASP